MIAFVKNSVSAIASADGIMSQITLFVKAIFQNKEMLVACLTAVICICVVYAIRRMAMDYAWTIAAAAGALINVIVYVAGAISLNLDISYGSLIIGNVIAVGVGLVLQFFFFSVDYSRTESLQFEDDEYYYYVKAVPKMSVAMSTKTVKRINPQKADMSRDEDYSSGRTAERTVVMERTASAGYRNTQGTPAQRAAAQRVATRGEYRTGKSVTMGSTGSSSERNKTGTVTGTVDDYEEQDFIW